jgi:uncharacterized membrane protein
MALDHANHVVAQQHSPGEYWGGPLPVYPDALAFLTRFVTHLCAPGFFFLMGVGIVLFADSRRRRGWDEGTIGAHFLIRGVLLIALQFLIVNRAWELSPGGWVPDVYVGVLFALGGAMILSGGTLLWLGPWYLLGLTLALLIGTELLTPNSALWERPFPLVQQLLLVPGGDAGLWVNYPLLPWLGLVTFGMAFGHWVAGWDPDQIHDVKEFDRKTLQDGLDWLEANAGEDDLILVYVSSHGRYLRDVLMWDEFFADEWAEIPSEWRLLIVDSCQAADYAGAVSGDPRPYLSIAAVDSDEYGWSGLEEEGLPIIGGVFTHYFAAAFGDPKADGDGDGCVSVQEAALLAEEEQRAYMHDVVFAVPEFLEMYHRDGTFPDQDPTFPDVVVKDTIGEPVCLTLNGDR